MLYCVAYSKLLKRIGLKIDFSFHSSFGNFWSVGSLNKEMVNEINASKSSLKVDKEYS